jgi:hypothetical protein
MADIIISNEFKQQVKDVVKRAELEYDCEIDTQGIFSFKGRRVPRIRPTEEKGDRDWDYEDIFVATKIINVLFIPSKTISRKDFGSYALKHYIESFKFPSYYISNGNAIVAMLMCGYKLGITVDINCHFNVKRNKNIPKRYNLRYITNYDKLNDGVYIYALREIYGDEYMKFLP